MNSEQYCTQVQEMMPEAGIIRVALSGSYSRGTPTEDSDVDMEVVYTNAALTPHEIAEGLAGRVHGACGTFDIHPRRASE